MPVFTSSIEVTADYPTIKPSLNLNFARSRSLDPRITFTRASTATYVGRDGLIKTAGVDEARFDHDPDTLESLGLLIEESRTNNALYSDDFNNGAWLKQTGHGLTSNTTIAPDGTQTADTFNRGASNQYIYQSIGITGTYTMSVWVKTPSGAGNLGFVMQHYNTTNGGLGIATFTATEEWQRFSIQASPTVGGGWYPCIPTTLNQDYHVWGAQIEQGAFPTSYIPTAGSSATRAADIANILGESFSNTFNTLEGTFIAECDRGNDGTEGAGIGAMRRPANSYFDMIQFGEFYDNSGDVGRVYVGGTSQAQIGATHTTGQGVYNRYSFAYKTDSFAGAINGVLQNEDTSGSLPTGLDRFVFGGYADDRATNSLDGHIKSFSYYPKRLTNAQLQLLTS